MTPQDKKLNELSKVLDGLQKELIAIRDSLQREPREIYLYYNIHGRQWRSLNPDEAKRLADDIEVIKVKEVIE